MSHTDMVIVGHRSADDTKFKKSMIKYKNTNNLENIVAIWYIDYNIGLWHYNIDILDEKNWFR